MSYGFWLPQALVYAPISCNVSTLVPEHLQAEEPTWRAFSWPLKCAKRPLADFQASRARASSRSSWPTRRSRSFRTLCSSCTCPLSPSTRSLSDSRSSRACLSCPLNAACSKPKEMATRRQTVLLAC